MPSDKPQQNEVSLRHAHAYIRPVTNTPCQGEKEFSIQPINESGHDPKFAPFNAHPGPAKSENMPQQEGSKEDRQAKKEALNK
jgi:hypothetical protein